VIETRARVNTTKGIATVELPLNTTLKTENPTCQGVKRPMNEQDIWNNALGETILKIGGDGFEQALIQALECLVSFDFAVMFGYRGDEPPIVLYESFSSRTRDIHVTKYVEGPYLLDPFFQATRALMDSGLYRLKEIAPDRFYQSEYYRSYYSKTDLAEEIGFFVSLPNSTYIVISLMRMKRSSVFSRKEFKLLKSVETIVQALSSRHWENLVSNFSEDEVAPDQVVIKNRVNEVFNTFGESILTPRECEVVGLILRGYSSEAIAGSLGIAKGTVKTFRRSIHSKLRISSQSELFSMFISALQVKPPAPDAGY